MRKRKYIFSFLVAVMSLAACSESLEDTYSEYAGDGKIRYVAKCFNVGIIPGWERLILSWDNGSDATVEKIKIRWTFDEKKDSVYLPKNTTTFELKNLVDGTYRFDINVLDAAGNESLGETTYGRPYTRDHEVMRAFSRGILKSFFVGNNMIFFSDKWNENIEMMKLSYKDTEGNPQEYVFDKAKGSYDSFITIKNVSTNPADSVYILRKGKLDNSPDIITFDPLTISRKRNFSAGFVNTIEQRYGYSTDTKEGEIEFEKFVDTVRILEFDRDIETFEDVLYCPKIEKLVFGKNRFLNSKYSTDKDRSILQTDQNRNILVLDKANELLGLEIDLYGNQQFKHYFSQSLPYLTYKGYPVLPDMEVIGKEDLKSYSDGSKVTCFPPDPYAKLDNLVDDSSLTRWETTSYNSVRTYEMQMELKEETVIRGIKIVQALYDPRMDQQTPKFMPSYILIQTSVDGGKWEYVTFFESNVLGLGSGEVTLLPIAEGSRQVRYIKFTLRDRVDEGGFCMIKLGDILPYK